MPYTKKQCKYFGWAVGQGKDVPKDWKAHCKKGAKKKKRK